MLTGQQFCWDVGLNDACGRARESGSDLVCGNIFVKVSPRCGYGHRSLAPVSRTRVGASLTVRRLGSLMRCSQMGNR